MFNVYGFTSRFKLFLALILLLAFILSYLLFFYVYVVEVKVDVVILGEGVISIDDRLFSSNSTLIFKLVKHGFLGFLEPLTLRVEAKPSRGWMVGEILFNNKSCIDGVVEVLGDGVLLVDFDRVVSIRYPSDLDFAGLDLDGDGLFDFIIEVNLWNTRSASGTVNMTFNLDRGVLYHSQCLWNLVPKYPEIRVFGYPGIWCGNKPWNSLVALDSPIPIPDRVSSLNDFYVTLNYNLSHNSQLSINLAVESWFTRDKFRFTGVFEGEVEVMIWLYWHDLSPAGFKVDELIVPIEVNGEVVNCTFEVWYANMTWHYIAFKIFKPIKFGVVRFNYAPFIRWVYEFIGEGFEYLYLEDVEVGVEFGESNSGAAVVSWFLYDFSLQYTVKRLLEG